MIIDKVYVFLMLIKN